MITPRIEEENALPPAPSRPLTEDVLQSAEQAVLSNPASDGLLLAAVGHDAAAPGVLTRYRDSLADQVARKPGQSALLALAAGALGAALLRTLVSRRRRHQRS
ncbi:hypothetical protein [Polaromonas sp. AER18D-145]|uniref:hypothetical protein n=1 Tax=Polaromonas sp. AER18D-145 TaxID=1977060 RepID=UPI000BBC8CA2|nr:hypothetical protein [Polaromonas sp. AER18D-145]